MLGCFAGSERLSVGGVGRVDRLMRRYERRVRIGFGVQLVAVRRIGRSVMGEPDAQGDERKDTGAQDGACGAESCLPTMTS